MRTKKHILLLLLASAIISPILFTGVHAACSPCSLEADTNVPATSTVLVRMDGGAQFPFNHTFSVPWNTTHTLQVMNTSFTIPSTGARYVFKQWLHNSIQWDVNPTITIPYIQVDYTSASGFGGFEAQFEKQFQLSLSFKDPVGQPVNPPTSITLDGPFSVTFTAGQYSNQWLPAATWTASDATWEGISGTVLSNALCPSTIDLTQGSITANLCLKAYDATFKVVDQSNNPVSGATVTVTLVNGTSITRTSDSQGTVSLGRVPLGTYTAHVVYQGSDMGSYTVDASINPVDTVKLSVGGGVSAPIVSTAVLLTVFGLALFLVLLAIKVRKPPAPPVID